MSYTPTQWQTGDTITAEKLNNMESGIAANDFVLIETELVTLTVDDKTYYKLVVSSPAYPVLYGLLNGGHKNFIMKVPTSPFGIDSDTTAPVVRANTTSITADFGAVNTGALGNLAGLKYAYFAFLPERSVYELIENLSTYDEPFVVTCAPTAQDFSGVMDKTVAEINEAYEAGRKIVFRMAVSATEYMDVDCTYRGYDGSAYPSFNASLVVDNPIDAFVLIYTGGSDDGTKTSYNTIIYPLTPMS